MTGHRVTCSLSCPLPCSFGASFPARGRCLRRSWELVNILTFELDPKSGAPFVLKMQHRKPFVTGVPTRHPVWPGNVPLGLHPPFPAVTLNVSSHGQRLPSSQFVPVQVRRLKLSRRPARLRLCRSATGRSPVRMLNVTALCAAAFPELSSGQLTAPL